MRRYQEQYEEWLRVADPQDIVLASKAVEHCLQWLKNNATFAKDFPAETKVEEIVAKRGKDGFNRPALILKAIYRAGKKDVPVECWLRDPHPGVGYHGVSVFVGRCPTHRFRGCIRSDGVIEMVWG